MSWPSYALCGAAAAGHTASLAAAVVLAMWHGGCRAGVEHKTTPAAAADVGEIDVAPYAVPGEHLVLRLTYYGVTVGRIEYRVGEPGFIDGTPAIISWSEARSDGLLNVFTKLVEPVTTAVSVDDGLPIWSLGSFKGLMIGGTEGETRREWPRQEGVRIHNTQTAYLAVRGWDPPEGTRGFVQGRVGWQTIRLDLVAAGREVITLGHGPMAAVRYDGVVSSPNSGRSLNFVMWFSDDADRTLLRLRSETDMGGTIVAEMVSYDRP